jgi:peptidoglycan/LPS O-acetylase OafA/YrhL
LEFLRHLGDISYSTYLLHTLVIGVFLHYVSGQMGSASSELLLLLAASLTIALMSHISFRYIETGRLTAILKKKIL